MLQPDDSGHVQFRNLLRLIGPLMMGVGGLFVLIGMVSFFSGFASPHLGPPKFFWCAFIGMPMVAFGLMITRFAFLGAGLRYMANEAAPVGKDVTNYMVEETKETMVAAANTMVEGTKGSLAGVAHDVAAAVSEGLREGTALKVEARSRICPKCQTENEALANFCKSCGSPMGKTRPCAGCNEMNDQDARFCSHCGQPLA
jgi:membrane protease subunit (stomatin/prohibitin family)